MPDPIDQETQVSLIRIRSNLMQTHADQGAVFIHTVEELRQEIQVLIQELDTKERRIQQVERTLANHMIQRKRDTE